MHVPIAIAMFKTRRLDHTYTSHLQYYASMQCVEAAATHSGGNPAEQLANSQTMPAIYHIFIICT